MPSTRPAPLVALALLMAAASSCAPGAPAGLTVDGVLHLADRLAQADASSGAPPLGALQRLGWDLRDQAAEWRSLSKADNPRLATVLLAPADDGLSLTLARSVGSAGPFLIGGLLTELQDVQFADWETVLVRARTHDRFAGITVAYNVHGDDGVPNEMLFFFATDEAPPLFNDGSEQVYAIPLRPPAEGPAPERLESLAVVVAAPGGQQVSVELQSIQLVPRGAGFPDETGVRSLARDGEVRRTLYAHTPARLSWQVAVPEGGRLDFALSALEHDPVDYTVRVDDQVLLQERVDGATHWQQRSVSLSGAAGRTATVTLEATAESDGAVALWGAPAISRTTPAGRPNVLFYVIDGGGADFMSVYEYNRRTTPFLERLAAEGVVFERAYSNATWTQPSTVSFMTSLQHSVLGGLRRGVHSTPVPAGAKTFAEHMREAGYMTASFTANPNAGRIIGLDRGIDVMSDVEEGSHSTSSAALHERFWALRNEYPGTPYWVHFQTTDVHEPNVPVSPYAGLFVSPEQRAQLAQWDQQMWSSATDFGTTSIFHFYEMALQRAGIDQRAYFEIRRGLYDETMAYQDRQLSLLVQQLKARGEWDNTILVIGSDHGHPAGTFARFGRGLFDPQPEPWEGALFDSYATRVPMIVVWPAGIAGGRRISQPVSMIDVLPTVLDLAGLPMPEVLQGQTLAPALRGDDSWRARPVILDEFRIDEATGEWIGNIEIVDGRWGASLEIGPAPEGSAPGLGRHEVPIGGRWGNLHRYFPDAPRLLLYDLWNDPYALHSVNDAHPELVQHYRDVLEAQWQAHRALAQRFGEAGDVSIDPEQLQQLRSLGYIR